MDVTPCWNRHKISYEIIGSGWQAQNALNFSLWFQRHRSVEPANLTHSRGKQPCYHCFDGAKPPTPHLVPLGDWIEPFALEVVNNRRVATRGLLHRCRFGHAVTETLVDFRE